MELGSTLFFKFFVGIKGTWILYEAINKLPTGSLSSNTKEVQMNNEKYSHLYREPASLDSLTEASTHGMINVKACLKSPTHHT